MQEQIKQLSVYLKEQLAKGVSEESLKQASLAQGWAETDFQSALSLARFDAPLPPTPNNDIPPAPASVPLPPHNADANNNATATPVFTADTIMKNNKLVDTVKTFLIASPILNILYSIIGLVVINYNAIGYYKYLRYSKLFKGLDVSLIIYAIITGLIYGLIGGIIFYFLYNPVKNFVKDIKVLKPFIVNMFTLIWMPTLILAVIGLLFSLLNIFSEDDFSLSVLLWTVVPVALNLVINFFYAKFVSQRIEKYYPW